MPHDLVTIAVFNDAVSAQAARGHLLAHGVRAFVLDEHTTTLMPHLDMALGVRLQVPRSEAERAHALLAEAAKGTHALDEAEDYESDEEAAHGEAPAPDGPPEDRALWDVPSRGHMPDDAPAGRASPADERSLYRTGHTSWARLAFISAIVIGLIAAVLWSVSGP